MFFLRVDAYYEGGRDFYEPFLKLLFEDVTSSIKGFTLPRYLGIFEKVRKLILHRGVQLYKREIIHISTTSIYSNTDQL